MPGETASHARTFVLFRWASPVPVVVEEPKGDPHCRSVDAAGESVSGRVAVALTCRRVKQSE